MEKLVLGLSGGVDSAVAGAILKNQGFELTGVYLDIGMPDSVEAAEKAAHELNIDFRVINISDALEQKVCSYFVSQYLHGKTPNPCILCNPTVKFPALLAVADEIGAKYIATGHYAKILHGKDGKAHLLRGGSNDQSYMLCRLTQDILSRLFLPLGDFQHKSEVRAFAESYSLSCAESPDSMEICFIPDNDYSAYIESRGNFPPSGNFIDEKGKILGQHLGIHHYTVGQRRGLGIAAGARLFVSEIRPETNEVVLSFDKKPVSELFAENPSWTVVPPVSPFEASVKLRHSKKEFSAKVFPGNEVKIVFDEPVVPSAAGQSAAFYVGDELIGSGFIEKT